MEDDGGMGELVIGVDTGGVFGVEIVHALHIQQSITLKLWPFKLKFLKKTLN